jgi:hypothetical protein
MADAHLPRRLPDTVAFFQRSPNCGLDCRVYPSAAEQLAGFPGSLQPGVDALADHAAFELGERAGNLEDQFAHRRGGVDVVLIKGEVDATRFQVLNRTEQVDQLRPTRSIAQAITTSNLPRLTSLSIRSRPGRYFRSFAPETPASL